MNYKVKQWSVVLSFLLLLFACKKDDNDNNNNGGGGGEPNNQKAVSISNFSFSPSSLTIAKDVTVTWTNNDTAPHTVTADDNSFTSGTMNKGDTYSRTFTSAGTVAYHCAIHPAMTASVVVQ